MAVWKAVRHPHLYEVNTRVLLRSISKDRKYATLNDVPDSYWESFAIRGINWIWLMGVWALMEKEHDPDLISQAMMHEFRALIPDLTDDDIDGSPYAIDGYTVDPDLGGTAALKSVRDKLNALGIGLMLDFIPNHFGAHSRLIKTHPQYFLQVDAAIASSDTSTFFQSSLDREQRYFAHGKDPYFAAWQDTVQIDYGNPETRTFMREQLAGLANLCDGVRCDMAMLVVTRVFGQTWGQSSRWEGEEFWHAAILQAKSVNPDFLMMAEVYWDMEYELLQMGFDYCYDKTFYDRLSDPPTLKAHFDAEVDYLEHTTRFLENHDEERVASRLSFDQHMAAAALIAFGPGMRFWHMGQWEGLKHKIPVQLNRGPEEICQCPSCIESTGLSGCSVVSAYYDKLFMLVNRDVLRFGAWSRIGVHNLYVWQWKYKDEELIVVINYSNVHKALNLADHVEGMQLVYPETVHYSKTVTEIWPWGMFVWVSSTMNTP